jgi:hypothetical protein
LRVALTVENGSLPNEANSYVSVSDTRVFAVARGITLPVTDAAVEVLLIRAMDYIEALRAEFQGSKLSKEQTLQWPRTGVVVDGFPVDDDAIPVCLVQAQMRLACYAQANGGTLTATSDGRVVIEERVEGAIDVKYADHGDSAPQPQFPEADALLAPLLEGGGSSGFGISVRV